MPSQDVVKTIFRECSRIFVDIDQESAEIKSFEEEIVLLDEQGNEIGFAPKLLSHHSNTPLHLAFSCYAIDSDENVLITQRSRQKKTWPGIWTNSCCGHPLPGESMVDAVVRRFREELGVLATQVEVILPKFRYCAVMPDGMVENEVCPVFRARLEGPFNLNPAEVEGIKWEPWASFVSDVMQGDRVVSPWCREQLIQLIKLGQPWQWPVGKKMDLPLAARK